MCVGIPTGWPISSTSFSFLTSEHFGLCLEHCHSPFRHFISALPSKPAEHRKVQVSPSQIQTPFLTSLKSLTSHFDYHLSLKGHLLINSRIIQTNKIISVTDSQTRRRLNFKISFKIRTQSVKQCTSLWGGCQKIHILVSYHHHSLEIKGFKINFQALSKLKKKLTLQLLVHLQTIFLAG